MPNKYLSERRLHYQMLEETLKQKGRIPFKKGYQKYAKLMMFIHDTLFEMATQSNLQNGEGILYKINFPAVYSTRNMIDYNGKIVFEYAIRQTSARYKSFEIQHMSVQEVYIMLETFMDYYGLILKKEENRFERFTTSHKYTVCLPERKELE